MSRWFIAVFSLHFVVSVALSTLGLAPWRALPQFDGDPANTACAGTTYASTTYASTTYAGTTCASVQRPAAPLVDTASLLDDFDHALMDDQQDLPDVMHAVDGVAAPRLQADRHLANSLREGPWRSLAPPDRPPRLA